MIGYKWLNSLRWRGRKLKSYCVKLIIVAKHSKPDLVRGFLNLIGICATGFSGAYILSITSLFIGAYLSQFSKTKDSEGLYAALPMIIGYIFGLIVGFILGAFLGNKYVKGSLIRIIAAVIFAIAITKLLKIQ